MSLEHTDQLRKAAQRLQKSERGKAALRNLQRLFIDGGSGLDQWNQDAANALFQAMLHTPWDWPAELAANRPREEAA